MKLIAGLISNGPFGVWLQQEFFTNKCFYERYKWLETVIYVLISVLPAIPFILEADFEGKWELKVGGACYMVGVIFFKCDGVVPLAHAIWHIHVAIGASFHYYAVLTYLVGPKSELENL